MQASLDTMIAAAATGPSGRQNTAAMTHRQPTPGSVAAAEAKLEEAARIKRAVAAMAQAQAADRADDASACQRALAEVRRSIGQ